jgi:hypothetical protein
MEKHHQHYISNFSIDKSQDWKYLDRIDFEHIFDLKITDEAVALINQLDLGYRFLTVEERDSQILKVLRILDEPLVSSGSKRLESWEKGWDENFQDYINSSYNETALLPYYYRRGQTIMRLRGDYILPRSPHFEAHFLFVLQVIIANAYFRNVSSIYEFGCGPGHNLLAFGRIVSGKDYHGLDWASASQKILRLVDSRANKTHCDNRFHGHFIDLFHPDPEFHVNNGSAIFTFGSMEQLGTDFEPQFDYFYSQPAAIYVHIEPFTELSKDDVLLDVLADRYAKKRNYLDGYLRHLEKLQNSGMLKIIKRRKLIGSTFNDGWCLVVWERC